MSKQAPVRSYPVVGVILDMLGAWLAHAREVAEVCRLDPAEHDRIAREIGVSPDDLHALVRKGPDAAEELPRLLRLLGFDPAALAAAQAPVMRQMQSTCSMCEHKQQCGRDLASGTEAYRDYCGNALQIAALSPAVH